MKILAIETSSIACSVALLCDNKITEQHIISPKEQAKRILPTIEECLAQENLTINQIDAFAYGCGPGSFTGVRIAASVIQGLAFATKKPVISVSSLAAIAQSAFFATGWQHLLVAMDARINEVYWGAYVVKDGIVRLLNDEKVTRPDEIEAPGKTDWFGVGNGWEVYTNEIGYKPVGVKVDELPTAKAVAILAKVKYFAGELVKPSEALPVYLRNDVAKKKQT